MSVDENPWEESTWRPARPKAARKGQSGEARPRANPEAAAPRPGWFERILGGGVGPLLLSTYCRQWSQYWDAGIDLNRSLAQLSQRFRRSPLGPATERVRTAIRSGADLPGALAREKQVFDPLFLAVMRVADARGGAVETLRELADYYEARGRLVRRAKSAMIYPAIVLAAALGVTFLISIFLLPMFAGLLADLTRAGGSLPLPSRVLMAFSGFMASVGWWVVPLAVIGSFLLLRGWYRTALGKAILDRVLIRLPVFGQLLRLIDQARLSRALSALLEGGVAVLPALQLSQDVVRLDPFRKAVLVAAKGVRAGETLADSFAESPVIDDDTIAVINTGEETGKLPEALNKLAEQREEQIEHTVRNLGALIQPIVMVLLGGLVLFIILAVLLPYISALTSLAG
jgi:type IV pilus assembly protein PilC